MNSYQKKKKIILNDFTNQLLNRSDNKNYIKENDDDDNFWDIDGNIISNNLDLSGYDNNKNNNKYNFDIKTKLEQDNRKMIYYNQLIQKTPRLNHSIYGQKNKTMLRKESKKIRNNSVEIDKNSSISIPKKKKIKIDDLSVFNRNQIWLKNKNEKISKKKETLVDKREKEYFESLKPDFIKKPLELEYFHLFNEKKNVRKIKENQNFFWRLDKKREDIAKALYLNNISHKVNILKTSHYSGMNSNNITSRQMNKFIKFINDKLKGKK